MKRSLFVSLEMDEGQGLLRTEDTQTETELIAERGIGTGGANVGSLREACEMGANKVLRFKNRAEDAFFPSLNIDTLCGYRLPLSLAGSHASVWNSDSYDIHAIPVPGSISRLKMLTQREDTLREKLTTEQYCNATTAAAALDLASRDVHAQIDRKRAESTRINDVKRHRLHVDHWEEEELTHLQRVEWLFTQLLSKPANHSPFDPMNNPMIEDRSLVETLVTARMAVAFYLIGEPPTSEAIRELIANALQYFWEHDPQLGERVNRCMEDYEAANRCVSLASAPQTHKAELQPLEDSPYQKAASLIRDIDAQLREYWNISN